MPSRWRDSVNLSASGEHSSNPSAGGLKSGWLFYMLITVSTTAFFCAPVQLELVWVCRHGLTDLADQPVHLGSVLHIFKVEGDHKPYCQLLPPESVPAASPLLGRVLALLCAICPFKPWFLCMCMP